MVIKKQLSLAAAAILFFASLAHGQGRGLMTSPVAGLVLQNFGAISAIPRESKKEHRMKDFIAQAATRLHLLSEQDEAGNLRVEVPASPGLENAPGVIFQSHLDMVCVKDPSSNHSFVTDPILPVEKNGWIGAQGTTLGADNGIGVAMMLTLMEDSSTVHGPLELLFTVDEEGDFSGADGLREGWLKGKYLINLDSEENREFNIGCAGGETNVIFFPFHQADGSDKTGMKRLRVSLQGLTGGHSGVDIHRQRANAIILLTLILQKSLSSTPWQLVSLTGGTTDTAIPEQADAVIALPARKFPAVVSSLGKVQKAFQMKYRFTDPGWNFAWNDDFQAMTNAVFTQSQTQDIVRMILTLPRGIIARNREKPDIIETSLNLGVAETGADGLTLKCHLQGSRFVAIQELARRVQRLGHSINIKVERTSPYPPWEAEPDSLLLATAMKVFHQRFGGKPKIKVVHAGVECGSLKKKYSHIEMLSFGPNIKNVHTINEQVEVSSIQDTWSLLKDLLLALGNLDLKSSEKPGK